MRYHVKVLAITSAIMLVIVALLAAITFGVLKNNVVVAAIYILGVLAALAWMVYQIVTLYVPRPASQSDADERAIERAQRAYYGVEKQVATGKAVAPSIFPRWSDENDEIENGVEDA